MLKVRVISKETIKPSSPTPQHLRSMSLSLLDQLAPPIYMHFLLFYSAGAGAGVGSALEETSRLKQSLSRALTDFYPLAGRIKGGDGAVIAECNDEGVDFVVARVDGELEPVLRQPPIEEHHQLLPIQSSYASDGAPLMAVQLNGFDCGGFVLGVCISHRIADVTSMAVFINTWAEYTRCGIDEQQPPPSFDSASIFPPVRLPSTGTAAAAFPQFKQIGVVPKRLVIGAREIEKLRGGDLYARSKPPTRVQAVSAFVWRCAMRAKGETARDTIPTATHVVNVRNRVSPPLTERSFGNAWVEAAARGNKIADDCGSDRQGSLEEIIRNAIGRVDKDFVRALAGEQSSEKVITEEIGDHQDNCELWVFSSWCRFPFYKIDFGWGEPVWLGSARHDVKNVVVLTDARVGDGMEVWLWLPKEEIERLERDPELLNLLTPPSV